MRTALGCTLTLVWLGTSAIGQSIERIPMPEGVFYYQPAAAVFGSEATWINPAGLGRYNAHSGQLMADYADDRFAKSWGWLTSAEQLALGWRKLDDPVQDYNEWIFAGAVPLERAVAIGFSYRYFSDGPGMYHKRHFWTIGLQRQGDGPLALGAVFSNLNRSRVNGQRTETEMRYSAGWRPWGEKVTLSADVLLSTGTRFTNADWIYHAEYTPVRGVFLNGFYDSNDNFQVGFRVNLNQNFFGSKSGFDRRCDHRSTTAFVGVTQHRQPSVLPPQRRRLALGLRGELPENPPRPVFGRQRASFADVLLSVYRAADDESINELVVTLNDASPGFARAQELRAAFQYFRSRGKRLICHLNTPTNLGYYLATSADSVFIPPVSQLNLVGLRAELTFYAGTLDKLGVKLDLIPIGEYKTAVEPWTRTASSPENREQVNRLLDGIFEQFVSDIADSRNLPVDSVKRIIDGGPYTSADALRHGLVDGLCYQDEVDSCIGASKVVAFRAYLADTLVNYSWDRTPVIAVVVAQGDITSDAGDVDPLGHPGGVTPSPFRRAFAETRRDPDVQGVVFRVDSPGGSALASDDIYHYSERLARHKPLVVSMGNVAASGGYYVAMPARRLFASSGTVTGSIGIYGGKADLSGLYEKIALGKELYTRGRFAGMLSWTAPFTPEERERYYHQLDAFYGHFLSLVSANRKLSIDSVDHLARGRVWTGREASRIGLIDEIGGLRQAIDYMASQLGTDNYRVRLYPEYRPLFLLPARSLVGILVGVLGGHGASPAELIMPTLPPATDGMLARMPYDLYIE